MASKRHFRMLPRSPCLVTLRKSNLFCTFPLTLSQLHFLAWLWWSSQNSGSFPSNLHKSFRSWLLTASHSSSYTLIHNYVLGPTGLWKIGRTSKLTLKFKSVFPTMSHAENSPWWLLLLKWHSSKQGICFPSGHSYDIIIVINVTD